MAQYEIDLVSAEWAVLSDWGPPGSQGSPRFTVVRVEATEGGMLLIPTGAQHDLWASALTEAQSRAGRVL